jgi:hypothetical protein
MPTEAPRPSSPEAEATFRQEFAQLDAALADLKPQTAAPRLDVGTASDFARDLDVFRSGEPGTATRPFGDWDLPKAPPKGDSVPPATPAGAAPSAQDRGTSDVAVSKAQPTGSRKVASPKKPAAPPAGAAKSKGSLASAFSSLLAAEQAHPPTPPAPTLSEADVLEVVRRVLARMSDETVQRILIETAERLIKDEVEKIKTTPT